MLVTVAVLAATDQLLVNKVVVVPVVIQATAEMEHPQLQPDLEVVAAAQTPAYIPADQEV